MAGEVLIGVWLREEFEEFGELPGFGLHSPWGNACEVFDLGEGERVGARRSIRVKREVERKVNLMPELAFLLSRSRLSVLRLQ